MTWRRLTAKSICTATVVLLLVDGSLAALPAVLSSGPVVFPLMAPKISSKYGKRNHPVRKVSRHHSGIDLASPRGAHVRAVLEGLVVFADEYKGFGKLVTVQHTDGYTSLYGHLDEIRVEPGDKVSAGQIVGRVGSTGLATGPHLHFEWRHHHEAIDPLKVFPELATKADG
jgi:murein DD-endopeptidase MepM/ murein hydrolase activator NlpD